MIKIECSTRVMLGICRQFGVIQQRARGRSLRATRQAPTYNYSNSYLNIYSGISVSGCLDHLLFVVVSSGQTNFYIQNLVAVVWRNCYCFSFLYLKSIVHNHFTFLNDKLSMNFNELKLHIYFFIFSSYSRIFFSYLFSFFLFYVWWT